jgi:A/G-specific adenine glycosylase
MLQQTRVETVVPYFERFVRELPDVAALAEASSDRVMSLWSGLGYYRRARMLHDAARQVALHHDGRLPDSAATLLAVRGIGRYTAGAIASIAYGERASAVDGNVVRVLSRVFAVRDDVRGGAGLGRIWDLADALVRDVPEGRAGDWNQALMELGAVVCVPRSPRCDVCPARGECAARARGIAAELPILSKKAKPAATGMVALVAIVRGRAVLARRRPGGLFGGLWEPPMAPVLAGEAKPDDAVRAFAPLLGVMPARAVFAGTVRHTLSHLRIEASVVTARLPGSPAATFRPSPTYDAVALVAVDALADRGVSTLAKRVLRTAGVLR